MDQGQGQGQGHSLDHPGFVSVHRASSPTGCKAEGMEGGQEIFRILSTLASIIPRSSVDWSVFVMGTLLCVEPSPDTPPPRRVLPRAGTWLHMPHTHSSAPRQVGSRAVWTLQSVFWILLKTALLCCKMPRTNVIGSCREECFGRP